MILGRFINKVKTSYYYCNSIETVKDSLRGFLNSIYCVTDWPALHTTVISGNGVGDSPVPKQRNIHFPISFVLIWISPEWAVSAEGTKTI